jgi:hypothetical protein
LSDPNGTYSGSFIDCLKEGKGIYKYKTALRYEDDYLKGVKKGKGKLSTISTTASHMRGNSTTICPTGKVLFIIPVA